MDEGLLNSASGDAIARDWELPELPSGTPSLPSTTSLPTSQELAEIFGTSDDEDDDYPFPLSSDLPTLTGSEAIETKQFPDSSLLSSIMAQDTGLFLDQLGDPLTMGGASEQASDVVKEEGASSTKKGVNDVVGKTLESGQKMEVPSDGTDNQSDPSLGIPAPVRKSTRLSSRQQRLLTEDIKPTKPAQKSKEDPKIPGKKSEKLIEKPAAKMDKPTLEKEVAAVKEEDEGDEEEEEEEDEDSEEESLSDDPDKLWCLCKKPHNDRFMICCDQCEEWYHGDCVGISVSQGKRMERAGKDYICPLCIEKGKLEKEVRAANRLARQAKREEVKEAKLKSKEKQISTKEPHPLRRRSSSSYKDSSDQYGLNLLFQPDNAPHRPSPSTSSPGKEQHGDRSHEGGGERRRRAFYREEVATTACLAPGCSTQTTPPSRYCSESCIESYAVDSLKKLANRGITFEANPSEFVRGSKGVSMVDKVTGKTVIGIQAPTDKTLASWIKQHQSYEVLLPTGKGMSSHPRPSRVRGEEGGGEGKKIKRERESPSKQRSLNDPETVRTNAKKALLQTLWKRKEVVDDVDVTQDKVEEIANQIEEELYSLHGDINTKYKTKYRSLLFNLKDTNNQGLFRKVCLSQISPVDLVRMKSEQFASDELAEWREKTLKKDLDKIVEQEEEARSSRKAIRKITYKGEVEIEAEKTEAIETIALSEESAVTPSTPLTPTAITKQAVQSQDEAKTSEDGTAVTGKQDSQAVTKTKPVLTSKETNEQKVKRSKDKEPKPKPVKPNKIEPAPKNEAAAVSSSDPEKKEAGKSQGGVLVDLLTDTTSDHGNHIYHPHCQICLGKKPPPPSTSTKDDDEQCSSDHVEEMQTESYYPTSHLPPLPLLWEGTIDMPGTVSFSSSAYPVSGDPDYITSILPSTLHVMGRIAHVQVWDYIDKLQTSSSREIVVLRFDWTEEDRDAYESLLNYLVRKHRCGVVDEHLHGIKDFYLVPLMVDQSVPNNLLPFDGPGLPEDRPNLLLGVVVQSKGIKPNISSPTLAPDFPLLSSLSDTVSSTAGLKRHLSTSSDDQAVEATAPKRKRRTVVVGFGGETPPTVEEDDSEPMDVGSPAKTEKLKMSFYGNHQPLSESNSPRTTFGSSLTSGQSSGIKSILSQLSDEKLKELASAMSSIEESSAPPPSSEASLSTVTSPATGQTVTTSLPLPAPSALTVPHTQQPAPVAPLHQESGKFNPHNPPSVSQLQRPPLHPAGPDSGNAPHNVHGHFSPGQPPRHQEHSYSSPSGPPQSNYNWDGQSHHPPQHYPANGPPDSFNVGGPPSQMGGPPPRHSGPPPQQLGPPHQYADSRPHSGSPQQYSGPPSQHSGGPPNQYSAPPPQHQSAPQQYSGPPSQHHSGGPHQYSPPQTGPPPHHIGGPHGPPQQYSGPPHQYSAPPPPEHSGPPSYQNAPPYSNYEQPHYRNQPPYPQGQGSWSQDGGYPPRHPQYYESESRLDKLESRDYGHRSQPPKHIRKPGHSGWSGRHDYRARDRR